MRVTMIRRRGGLYYTGNPYEPWTQHLYSYCMNNPTNFIDPTGHSAYLAYEYMTRAKKQIEASGGTACQALLKSIDYAKSEMDKFGKAPLPKAKTKEKNDGHFITGGGGGGVPPVKSIEELTINDFFFAAVDAISIDIGAGAGLGAGVDFGYLSGTAVAKVNLFHAHIQSKNSAIGVSSKAALGGSLGPLSYELATGGIHPYGKCDKCSPFGLQYTPVAKWSRCENAIHTESDASIGFSIEAYAIVGFEAGVSLSLSDFNNRLDYLMNPPSYGGSW